MLSLDCEEGGLKTINIENQRRMFRTKWSAELIRENDTFWAQIVKQLFKPLVKIQQYTELNGSPKLQPSHKQTKNQNKNLKQS